MTIPTITPYTGGVANPDGSQTQTEFTQNMFDQLSYEAQLASELNATVNATNATASEVEGNASIAQNSADTAQAAANFEGGFTVGVTSAVKGKSYLYNDNVWLCLQNTTTTPSSGNSAWKLSVGEQYVTESQEDLLPPNSSVFKGDDGVYLKNGDTVPAGTTHIRILAGGNPTIVAMSPIASGVVSSLSANGATIGGDIVTFSPALESQYYNDTNSSAIENMIADFNLNTISKILGERIKTGFTEWVYKDSTGPITAENFRALNAVSVTDTGVTGNEVDASTGLQLAIDTAGLIGASVYIPGGMSIDYFTSLYIPYSNMTIQGDGFNSELRYTGTGWGITIENTQYTHLSGFQLRDGSGSLALGGILFNNARRSHHEKVRVVGFDNLTGGRNGEGAAGLEIGESWIVSFSGFFVDACARGISLDSRGTDTVNAIHFKDTTLENNLNEAVFMYGVNQISFDGGTVESATLDTQIGFNLAVINQVSIEDMYFERIFDRSIVIQNFADNAKVTISECRFFNNATVGTHDVDIDVLNCRSVTIVDNMFEGDNNDAIRLGGALLSPDVIIEGNYINSTYVATYLDSGLGTYRGRIHDIQNDYWEYGSLDEHRFPVQTGSLTLENGWVNFGAGYQTIALRKDNNGFVHFTGVVTGGTLSSSLTVTNLPSGYRPTLRQRDLALVGSDGVARVDVASNGDVFLMPGGAGDSSSAYSINISFYVGF